jgi:hypothetical protein
VHAGQRDVIDGPSRERGQDDEALAPMAVFAVRGIAGDAGAGSVRLLKNQAGQAANDGLKLVVVGRAVGGEGDEGVQGGAGRGQIADPCPALGRKRLWRRNSAQRVSGKTYSYARASMGSFRAAIQAG